MSTNIHDTVKMKLAVFVSILFFIDITEIGKMFLEYSVEEIPSPGNIALGFGLKCC